MKRLTIPAILMAAVLAFALAGCSSAQNMTDDTLKGVWSLDKGSDVGFDAYLNFTTDQHQVEMIVADSLVDGTWSVSGTEGKATLDEKRQVKMTYSNNKLILGADDGTKLVFVKDDSDQAKEMFEYADYEVVSADGSEYQTVPEVVNPIDPVTIVDDDKISIVVTGKGSDYTGDPCYWITIKNKLDRAIYLVGEDKFKVGDKSVEAGLGDELEAGETLETTIYFDAQELGGGVELLTVTDGVIEVLDDVTDAEIAKYPFHIEA